MNEKSTHLASLEQNPQPNLIKGSIYVSGAFFAMALFGIFTKVATTKESSIIWISFLTYLIASIALIPSIFFPSKNSNFKNKLETHHIFYHLGRAFFGLLASFTYMISMSEIPIVNATLLFNTTPIFIPILAMLFLKDKISLKIWFAIILGFVGIIIIIKPNSQILTQPGDILGLASGFFLAIAYLLINVMTKTEPKMRIVAYFFFLSTLFQLPFLFLAGPFPSLISCLFTGLAGLSLLLAQILLVEGYKYAKASQVGIYQYLTVVFVGIFDWLIWGVIPPLSDLLGVILVVLAAIVIIRSKSTVPRPLQN